MKMLGLHTIGASPNAFLNKRSWHPKVMRNGAGFYANLCNVLQVTIRSTPNHNIPSFSVIQASLLHSGAWDFSVQNSAHSVSEIATSKLLLSGTCCMLDTFCSLLHAGTRAYCLALCLKILRNTRLLWIFCVQPAVKSSLLAVK